MTILQDTLEGKITKRSPCWLMRQSGRYLPKYHKLKANNPNFMDFCLDTDCAVKATLLPFEYFSLDAAIIFSDILTIPYAMGQRVDFKSGVGPQLGPITQQEFDFRMLTSVYKAIEKVKQQLKVPLIGFSAAPWTLACYMVDGKGPNFLQTQILSFKDPKKFTELIKKLTKSIIIHLEKQIESGVDIIQIFDSHAGRVPSSHQLQWIIEPTKIITHTLKEKFPHIKIISFPKGVHQGLEFFVQQTAIDVLSLDYNIDLQWAHNTLPKNLIFQGAIHPINLVIGGDNLVKDYQKQCSILKSRPQIINLGHGILPQTPPSHVAQLLELVSK